MTTRTIVTSQPDVACDVCERRLLRGEHHDIFLAAGRRRTVCELCAPRAAHEGWMRERDSQSVSLPPMRPRRGRSFFERLRQVGRPPGAPESDGESPADGRPAPSYDFLDGYDADGAPPARARPVAASVPGIDADENGYAEEAVQAPASYLDLAVEVFNASEYPRRVAGVARSLGVPVVNVRSAEHLESVVRIVVAWELCWYRYEVDLSEALAEARALTQGTELSELAPEEREANAHAGESGAIALTVA
ncbi:MAG TPA: hypothetical protein VII01_15115 [Solirubrobacteraceae bacterium]|jgi:hypothetical protein